jgi:hypothetical protein
MPIIIIISGSLVISIRAGAYHKHRLHGWWTKESFG